jgi:hypothetical protein
MKYIDLGISVLDTMLYNTLVPEVYGMLMDQIDSI